MSDRVYSKVYPWMYADEHAPYPKCAYCRADLIVPGEDCRSCGKPCIESFFAPEYLAIPKEQRK